MTANSDSDKTRVESEYVDYNGQRMRRDYAESRQAAQLLTHYYEEAEAFARVPYGQETFWDSAVAMLQPCSCCGALQGQLHEPLCQYEQCPKCGRQVMSCDCPFYAPED